jgi:RND family efflux transporter MFP subunit
MKNLSALTTHHIPLHIRRIFAMKNTLLNSLLICGLATCLAPPALAEQPLGCLIEAERVIDIGSPVIGVVEKMNVERGDVVVKDQILATLQAPVEKASVSVANSRATSKADVQGAQASAKFNRERLQRAQHLFQQQFISQQALDQARAESELADHKLTLVNEQRVMSRQELDVASAQLSQRVIRSPIDGVVAERFVSTGERIDEKPLLRVVKTDPLRVQLVVPVSMYQKIQMGNVVNVTPELPGAGLTPARVTMIDKVVDPASNTFRVHLKLPNPGGNLPPGLRCKAQLSAGATAEKTTPKLE